PNLTTPKGQPPLTTAPINGLGNLLIGYNEAPSPDPENMVARNGSHNLIVGPYHRYGNSGGRVAGFANPIRGTSASVSGGFVNSASGAYASVSGGRINFATGAYASVSGGLQNAASGNTASVSGGLSNHATGNNASVSGGENRDAAGESDWRAGSLFEEF